MREEEKLRIDSIIEKNRDEFVKNKGSRFTVSGRSKVGCRSCKTCEYAVWELTKTGHVRHSMLGYCLASGHPIFYNQLSDCVDWRRLDA